ncbi:hypothetical protein DEO72_LG3g874 [Vigna unguiculata]|uniref:Uncharacterized protein n=1 Tax=Vigna unguiculata TaxID=3917 RepID=A0A4D6LCY4_VIGUN|nr:hypothetical protein DEO72_LG3g874 [Vigna unguiculata]
MAAADGAAPPSPARLDGGGAMAAMAAAADVCLRGEVVVAGSCEDGRRCNAFAEFAVLICSSLLFCLALMVVREGWWSVLVVAADGDALVVAVEGGREIRVRVSCVRWRR